MAIKVMQQELHDPENGQIGDCLRACLATLLELSIEEVPHIGRKLWPSHDAAEWDAAVEKFLVGHGLYSFPLGTGYKHLLRGYCLASGQSPRHLDENHVVVYKDGEFWHDPHPDGSGLARVDYFSVMAALCT